MAAINEKLLPAPPRDGVNSGTLVLDATNECHENVEKLIDATWDSTGKWGHKTSYNRKKARTKYLKVAKQRKPRKNAIQQAIAEQLDYVERGIANLNGLLATCKENPLSERQKSRLVATQQREHAAHPTESISDTIVNVRPIVRGKAGHPVELGQKLAFSVVNGFAFMDKQSFESFNEGITLIESAEKYRSRFGCWPEARQPHE